ncbi:hypothetical protein QVD17_01108 [Tagetes erecta]|uniref:Uncharacterized protein n=1 Tax=Tagetes erecta TaxID=13708 RepID=A0AAD8P7U6_TARER|nr:hypothetical protein QVD17_01108 [Tagetes erecta]
MSNKVTLGPNPQPPPPSPCLLHDHDFKAIFSLKRQLQAPKCKDISSINPGWDGGGDVGERGRSYSYIHTFIFIFTHIASKQASKQSDRLRQVKKTTSLSKNSNFFN